ncbi:MAG: tetratricopeptide repeat protein, partial [Candidatus Omnitrophota bacterium]
MSKYRTLIALFILLSLMTIPLPSRYVLPDCWAGNEEQELFFVAQKAFEDGFYDVAIRYIEQFLQQYPQSGNRIQAKSVMGQCYFFKSQYLKAFEIFQELLKHPEMKDSTLFWLGETYLKGSDYTQAKKHYQELLSTYPQSFYIPQAYYSLAWALFEEQDFKGAKETFLKLAELFPENQFREDILFKLGECEYNLGSYEAATGYLGDYIKKYPKSNRNPDVYFYLGECYYYLGDYLTASTN